MPSGIDLICCTGSSILTHYALEVDKNHGGEVPTRYFPLQVMRGSGLYAKQKYSSYILFPSKAWYNKQQTSLACITQKSSKSALRNMFLDAARQYSITLSALKRMVLHYLIIIIFYSLKFYFLQPILCCNNTKISVKKLYNGVNGLRPGSIRTEAWLDPVIRLVGHDLSQGSPCMGTRPAANLASQRLPGFTLQCRSRQIYEKIWSESLGIGIKNLQSNSFPQKF